MPVYKWRRRSTKYFGDVWVPLAHIELRASDDRFQAFALQLDSGAVVSLLRRSVGDLLGLDLERGRRAEFASVGGGKTIAYIHELETRFADDLTVPVPFAISTTENVPNLLGRQGIFDRLQVDFDPTLDETSVMVPWLDAGERRVWDTLIATEQHILDRQDEIELPEPSRTVVNRFINRAEQILAASMGLVKLHRTYLAPVCVRTMFELALQFEYLMQDPVPRAQQYLNFVHIARYRRSKALVDNPSGLIARRLASSPKRPEGEKRNKKEYDRVRPQFIMIDERSGRKRLPGNWYCMPVHDLADKLGWLSEYKTWYAHASDWIHSDPFSTQRELPYGGKESQMIIWVCSRYYARMLLRLSDKIVLTAEHYELLKALAEDWD